MERNMIKVSVIMPVYNTGKYLATAVKSILAQSLTEFELILVDDGSTDGSSERCDEYAAMDNRVVVIHQKNGGICNARNAALKIAHGEYIAFSDHDDEYHVDLLRDNYLYAKENDLDFVKFCKKWYQIRDGKVLSEHENHIVKQIIRKEELPLKIYGLMDSRFCSCVWDGLFKRSFLVEHDIYFNPYFKMGGEDFDFILKCMKYVNQFGTNDKCYYTHYIRISYSTSTKFNPDKINVVKALPESFLETLQNLGIAPEDSRTDYTLFYTKFYLSSTLGCLKKQKYKISAAAAYLRSLKNEKFFFPFLLTTSIPLKKGKIYSIMHFLFAKKMYRTLFFFYKIFR